LFQAAGVIGASQRSETGGLQLFLESFPQRLSTLRVAATPLVASGAHVAANKDVMGKRRHV
jgi:hypothetical protein